MFDNGGDGQSGFRQVVGHIGNQVGALSWLDNKGVGKTVDVNTVFGPHALRPVVRQFQTSTARHVVAGTAFVFSANLKARGIDNTVDGIFNTANHNTRRSNPLDTLAIGIHQVSRGFVIGLQIFVVEAGPFAELLVPGLQVLGRFRIRNDAIDPGANLFHFLKV